MLPWILFAAAIILLVGVSFVAYRFYRKCVIYDEVFQFLADDVVANLMHFQKMMSGNVLSNEPEVKEASRLMTIMGRRLNEILQRMEEVSGLRLRPPPPLPRPVVR